MKNVLKEVHGRSLWQVVGLYLGASWLVLQISQTLTEGLGLPDWVVPFALILLGIGFPVVLATAILQRGLKTRAAEPARQSLADEPSGAMRLFTWRRALLGGLVAFTFLAILSTAWALMRSLGIGPAGTLVAKGLLDERGQLVLADFTDRAGDPDLAVSVTEALRVDLAQSTAFRLAETSLIATVRELMEIPVDAPLDETSARQLAQREGLKAVVAGDISRVGDGYLLVGRVVNVNGDVLVTQRATADGSADLLRAIDELSKDLRERIGESLRDIRAEPPLERVTTSNLEALRLYSRAAQALDRADYEIGLPLIERAVALDTAFAAAHRKMGVALGNRGEQRALRIEALTKAYAYRDRLTSRERLLAIASYHTSVTQDDEQALAAYESMLVADSMDHQALNNSAILIFQKAGFDEAIRRYERSWRAQPTSSLPVTNLLWPLTQLGRLEEAAAWVDTLQARFPENPGVWEYRAHLAWLNGDAETAERELLAMLEQLGGSPYWRAYTSRLLGNLLAATGRLAEAEIRFSASVEVQGQRGLSGEYIEDSLEMGWVDSGTRGDPGRALVRLRSALERFPWDDIPMLDRPYFSVSDYYSFAGRPDLAREVIEEFRSAASQEEQSRARNGLTGSAAEIALSEGRYEEAITTLRRLQDEGSCEMCPLWSLAAAYDGAGHRDSAIVAYERFVEFGWLDRLGWDGAQLGPAYERLADLSAQAGDTARVRRYSEALVTLWSDADAELQPRVELAARRLSQTRQ